MVAERLYKESYWWLNPEFLAVAREIAVILVDNTKEMVGTKLAMNNALPRWKNGDIKFSSTHWLHRYCVPFSSLGLKKRKRDGSFYNNE
jgi:hypothetical protein